MNTTRIHTWVMDTRWVVLTFLQLRVLPTDHSHIVTSNIHRKATVYLIKDQHGVQIVQGFMRLLAGLENGFSLSFTFIIIKQWYEATLVCTHTQLYMRVHQSVVFFIIHYPCTTSLILLLTITRVYTLLSISINKNKMLLYIWIDTRDNTPRHH